MNMEHGPIRILYLDDEEHNLTAFKAAFRRDYEVYTASTASEGHLILNEFDIQVVIADQRMPGTTGVEFFKSIIPDHPEPIRILLTGYTDVEAIINAINFGQIYRYVTKPWNELELRTAIANAAEIYYARKALQEKVVELERANNELNHFVYSASHDVRSPLMSILGIIRLAQLENSVQDPHGYLGMIKASVDRLDEYIQKIIEYYQNTRYTEEIINIDFASLVEECVSHFKNTNASVTFETRVKQQTPFYGDGYRTGLILNNLISNAIKYQRANEPQPKVKIDVRVENHRALITIEDNGIGIVNDHLSNIFRIFFRTQQANKEPGTGLGLYIVKEALNRMDGEIQVESSYGKGTQFKVSIPNRK